MKKYFAPEILSPAGNLEKLQLAVNYGANAVYLGGQNFSFRTSADNFSNSDLIKGVNFSHRNNVKVYVALNGLLHDKDILQLSKFVKFLKNINIDAVILSDLGGLSVVKSESDLPIHISTQASCLNVSSALFYKKIGVKRLILGREVSLEEAGRIKRIANIEVEIFIHGSMCIDYSGNCIIYPSRIKLLIIN